MIELVVRRVRPEEEEALREWFLQLRGPRRDEALGTLREEGIRHETAVLLAGPDGPLLVYAMESDDIDHARAVAGASSHEVDALHRAVLKRTLLPGDVTVEPLLDLRLPVSRAAVHHVELWTTDLSAVQDGWHWLLTALGWVAGAAFAGGRTWTAPDGSYLVLEQSPDVTAAHDRTRAGLNHLALTCSGRELLDELRQGASSHGWTELFADAYPHAGGERHTALFLENAQGFEVEVVA